MKRVDKFIENYPTQLADNFRGLLNLYKENKISKRDLLKKIQGQVEAACNTVDTWLERKNKD